MKAHVIYLPSVKHTVVAAQKAKTSCEKYGIECELFKGFLPHEADQKINELKIKPYLGDSKVYSIKANKGGVRGCFMSHFTLWNECANGTEDFLILEHDAILVKEVPSVEFQDVLHLDAWRFEDSPLYQGAEIEEYYEMRKGWKTMKGAYAYIVKPHAAQKLVEATYEFGFTAADMHISDRSGVYLERIQPRCAVVTSKISLTTDRNFS